MELGERQHKCRKYRTGEVRGLFDDKDNSCAGCHYYIWHKDKCRFPFKELTVPSKPHIKNTESKPLVDTTDINDKKEFILNNRKFLVGVFVCSFILTYLWAFFIYWRD